MNPSLEKIKEKLMLKPTANERQPVAVIINANAQPEKGANKMIIIDERNKGFNRDELLKKLEERHLTKVIMKPVLQVKEPSEIIPIVKKKKPKRVQFPETIQFIIEPEENENVNVVLPVEEEIVEEEK